MKQFSKNTLRLLRIFYTHPQEQFYIQQLGRMMKKKPGVFQRSLYNLEKEGVLKSDYKANARFFSLNKHYRFYKEFKSIVAKIASLIIIVSLLNLGPLYFSPAFAQSESSRQRNEASPSLPQQSLAEAGTTTFSPAHSKVIPVKADKEPQNLSLSSLKDTIKIAYKNNKDIKIQEYMLKVASAEILYAKSEFLPKLDYNAGYTHNGAVLNTSNTPGAKKDIRIFSGYKNDNAMSLNINEIVYNGGANIAGLREAQIGLKEQIETLRATKLNVELEAKRLYYGLLLAYETKRIAQDLVEQAQSHYEEVENRFKQGTSSRFDVLQSKVQVSLLMPQLISAQNAIELIIAEMDKLLGLKVGDKLVVNDKLIYQAIEIKEEDFLKEAYLNEPEMILKSLGIDMEKWAIKYAKAGWLPQVNAGAEYSYRSSDLGNMFNKPHNNWNIGFSVRVPIFDGFSTKAKVDSAKAKYMQALIKKDNLADQVAVDVKQACLDLIKAATVIKSQQDSLEDAKEALKISYVRYDNGVGINLDVLDAQVSLANVEKNLAEGIYDYIMAQAELDRLMGRSSIEEKKI